MTNEEWLGDYFGTPFDEVLSVAGLKPSLPPPPSPRFPGLLEPGNIDYATRPVIHNDDGTLSTVRGKSFGTNRGEVLVPTISDDGQQLNDSEAMQLYRQTGKHLGIFDSPEAATSYSNQFHDQMGPSPVPQASPSELPSPPSSDYPVNKFTTSLLHLGQGLVPHGITWDDLNQKVDLSDTPFPETIQPSQEALGVSGTRPFPMGSNPMENVPPGIGYVFEAPRGSQERWDRSTRLVFDVLGAARMLAGGTWGLGTDPIYRPKGFTAGEAQLPQPRPVTGYRLSPPPTGQAYLEAFRNAMSKNDEVGAINILRNAGKQDVSIPFRPNDYFSNPSFYVMKELDKYTLQTKGYSPFETIFRPPPAP